MVEFACAECGQLCTKRSRGKTRVMKYCSRKCNGLALRKNEEWHKKLSDARLGKEPWNKGVSMWETREHPRGTLGKKMLRSKPVSAETRRRLSESHKGQRLPESRKGKNHHWWKGGKTTQTVRDRSCVEYNAWRVAVFVRDGRKCSRCGSTANIHAHHIKPFAERPDLRFETSNGITLCAVCHGKEHGITFTEHALNHCEACGKKIKVGARFCRPCKKQHTADKYRCLDCGSHIGHDKSSKRCRSCAAKHRVKAKHGEA